MRKLGGRVLLFAAAIVLPVVAVGSAVAAATQHTVGDGETLSGIAQAYNVTVDALAQLNHIANPNLIFSGQILNIGGPQDNTAPSPSATASTYDVQPGDTLSAISSRFNVSVAALASANGLENSDLIVVGQRLTIPQPVSQDVIANLPAVRPSDPQIEGIIDDLSSAEGVDPKLVRAIAWVESSWQQGAVSSTGAVGLMQIMPDTAAWLEKDVFGYPLNEDTSMYDNIKAGVKLLRILIDATGDTDLALASYYQGQGTTASGVFYKDTQDYVRTVNFVKDRFWP